MLKMNKGNVLFSLKKWLKLFLLVAVPLEILVFPSLENAIGCGMAATAYFLFSHFLERKYVLLFPFSFMMFLSMFLYRYLPLIATLVEGKPITYGLERPLQTFLYETALFGISTLAFFLACKPNNLKFNNVLQNGLLKLNFYYVTPSILWALGGVGLVARLMTFGQGDIEYGDVGGKFSLGLVYLMFAPLCLLFPQLLLNVNYKNKRIIWLYLAVVFIINIASNSREAIITPIAIFLLLYFIYMVKENISLKSVISPFRLVLVTLFFFFGLNILGDLSLAMLSTRSVREDVGKMELFEETIKTYRDEKTMEGLRSLKKSSVNRLISYSLGWSEDYIDNFLLNRYANIRITDQTLYYAEKKGYDNPGMFKAFKTSLLNLLPTPIAKGLGIEIDKEKTFYSRGDLLAGRGGVSCLVTSHVGDGLVTFGYIYFLYQFVAFFLIFKLLNTFVVNNNGAIIYAPFALMNVFIFLGMFRNANGITGDISYILRGYWQGILTYCIVFFIVKYSVRILRIK
jgi:hypothetical protein